MKWYRKILIFLENVCTREYQETDLKYSWNGKQRPPAGTKCVKPCLFEAGRWGSSWCYTEEKSGNWGAGCVPCPPGDSKSFEFVSRLIQN